MFDKSIYIERRKKLKELVGSGLIYLPGNIDAAMNYPGNTYRFRQDSSFLYYFGLDAQDLYGVIDVDENTETIFGDDRAVDDIVWMGEEESITSKAASVGITDTEPLEGLLIKIKTAIESGQKIHYLPQYRGKTQQQVATQLGISPNFINEYASSKLIRAIVKQRSIKSQLEIDEIEKALDISFVMNTLAMKMAQAGKIEREIAGAIEGIALSMGSGVSFPIIFSIHGETLHNHHHDNVMQDGDILVLDSGAESGLHYASDITRSFPVSGKFSDKQKDIYNIVLQAQLSAIELMKPGVKFKEAHLKSAKVITEGLTGLGLMKGNSDDAVEAGAHALFFPHGLGHMMGLDVHDMEGLGENYVGYDKDTKRSDQFGLAYLRLARELEPGFVLTAEPGIYFIPQLIENWKAENKCSDFINYSKLDEYLDFGGIRIEDDVLITDSGHKVLGKLIPKTADEVEEYCNNK